MRIWVVLCCCSLASSLTKAEETLEIDDGYGSPAAPVLTSYQQPESYTLPVKVKKSVVSNEIEDEIDGYGSPAAPVLGSSQLPSYSPAGPPPVPSRYPKRRPNRPLYRRKPKFNWLHYMPMMNLLMLASSRKPKRHILPYQGKPVTNRHVRMPSFRFRMPQFRTPSPLKFLTSTPTFATKKPTKYYKKPSKGHIKLEYSGWKPIEISQYSPQAPSQEYSEPEIITIDNAHRHPKKYEVPDLPTGNYAPEPITAKPNYLKDEEETASVVYGAPEIAGYDLPPATYEPQSPPAPIEEPIFEHYSAPVQDLTSLAAVDEIDTYSGYSQVSSVPPAYQATYDSNHLAQEVQSGSVYVQHGKPTASAEDEDLYYIFYDETQQSSTARPYTPAYSSRSPSNAASTASFSIHVNGQSHGFSHNTDHRQRRT